jgi:RNA polymerase sigma-70 factor (ECF subfamily)
VTDGDPVPALREQYGRQVFRWILRVVRNYEDAEDVAQEVWVKVADGLPHLRNKEKIAPWLFQIARNSALDLLEKQKSRPQAAYGALPEDYGAELASPEQSQPEQELLRLDQRRQVWEALGYLSERDRTALSLREYHALSYREIGEALAISRGAAEVLVFRARQRFRQHYQRVENAAPSCGAVRIRIGAISGQHVSDDPQLREHFRQCSSCSELLQRISLGRRVFEPVPATSHQPAVSVNASAWRSA